MMRRRMKGRKDEKRMGPLFPKLHINDDKEKAGPRAPPRNKMALYEQLSIPYRRCGTGQTSSLPQPSTKGRGSIVVPSASSRKGSRHERNLNEKLHSGSPEAVNLNMTMGEFGWNVMKSANCPPNDSRHLSSSTTRHGSLLPDDFSTSKNSRGSNIRNGLSSSMQPRNSCEKHQKRTNTTDLTSRHGKNHSEEDQKEMQKLLALYSSTKENTSEPLKHRNVSRGDRGGSCSRVSVWNVHHQGANEAENGRRSYCEEKACVSLQMGYIDINDDTFEACTVDSISGFRLSPNDVVGVLGQKQFWNARRAILNQQRLFKMQVFELHRLIKVQRLIAGSPELLHEGNPCFSKPSPKSKSKTEEESQKSEVIPDSAVVNPPDPQFGPYSGPLLPPPVVAENEASPSWCFHPPPGNQMVLPVMPPSEGLPYTGAFPQTAGFKAPIYGGWGPTPVPSMAASCLNPAFGLPGVAPVAPVAPVAQAYPPVMTAVNSGSSLVEPQPDRKAEQLSTGETNFDMKSGILSNNLNQNDGTISCVKETQTPRDGESQNTILTSCETAAERAVIQVSEREFTLFHKTPDTTLVYNRVPETATNNQQQTPVIRVVPHNPRTAPESAARIFRCIQEERQQQHYVPV